MTLRQTMELGELKESNTDTKPQIKDFEQLPHILKLQCGNPYRVPRSKRWLEVKMDFRFGFSMAENPQNHSHLKIDFLIRWGSPGVPRVG